MPLVISKSGRAQYVPNQEVLAEILGHDNFDGKDWTIGDRLIFEDGTESQVKQYPGERFYIWDDPVPADFEEVKRTVGAAGASAWEDLFAHFQAQSRRNRGWLGL